jgi:hypothetical protein
MSKTKNLIELAIERQAILQSFEGDDATDDMKNMRKLYSVEERIALATFESDTDKLAGLRILLDMSAKPAGFDEFKTALFLRMQEFA